MIALKKAWGAPTNPTNVAASPQLESVKTGPAADNDEPGVPLIDSVRAGIPGEQLQLVRLIQAELSRLARRHLGGRRWMATLGTTCLVNETWVRLLGQTGDSPSERAHFFNLASRIMRQIVCDYARKRLRDPAYRHRGEVADAADDDDDAVRMARLDEALNELAKRDPRAARVIECRFFAGLTENETAEALGLSVRTAQRAWHEGRDWLARHLSER